MAQKKTPYRNAKPPAPEKGRRNWLWIGVAIATLAVASVVLYLAYTGSRPDFFDFAHNRPLGKTGVPVTAQYVGSDACASCHGQETAGWRKSQHHDAMAQASEQTVLGNFNNAKFAYAGLTSTFFKRGGEFFVNTEGRDGKPTAYQVKYTFGVSPLQQYLSSSRMVGFRRCPSPGTRGRRRKAASAGFTFTPTSGSLLQDELHWTRPAQNWNFMCADCHSTDVRKNYDPATDKFQTRWAEINVGCEACHGPGSRHWHGPLRNPPL